MSTSLNANMSPEPVAQGALVLVIGSGGREHAIAWALARSPHVRRVLVAPGNGGTAGDADDIIQNVALSPSDHDAIVTLARERRAALVVIGPEAPLAEGLADALRSAGVSVVGPGASGARLESSKAFAKSFMVRHGIPTASYHEFSSIHEARSYLESINLQETPVVLKADGLAAGKGVFLPETREEAMVALDALMQDRTFGAAGDTIVIEERLEGVEVSLLGFCDGETVRALPCAQDHKRALAGDRGPNTGGMGAVAPVPFLSDAEHEALTRDVLERTVSGLNADGIFYRGVLYAGLMLTKDGPRVLEFNCRLGDPETQAILPLVKTDLFTVMMACATGTLDRCALELREGAAATVVATSAGYPGVYEKGRAIELDAGAQCEGVVLFHAGTRATDRGLETAGGRVLAITGLGAALDEALARAYAAMRGVRFDGKTLREDIGWRANDRAGAIIAVNESGRRPVRYQDAGVDIDAGARAVSLMRDAVHETHGPEVIAGVGAFGGLFDASALQQMTRPVLVTSTDGVGTKTMIAARTGRFDTIGHDIVNHCVNDILVQGARPLMFLDYVASSRLNPEDVAQAVTGIAAACKAANCALMGGETAEMPGVYHDGAFDLVGTIVGVVERGAIITGDAITPGDLVLALPSSGLHTNGYSLARHVLADEPLDTWRDDLNATLGDALLTPHRSYLTEIMRALSLKLPVHGLVHITGGGLIDNPPRVLPEHCAMHLETSAWTLPPLFRLIQQRGQIEDLELARVFNVGLGMLIIVPESSRDAALDALGDDALVVGHIKQRGQGDAPVTLRGGFC